jgi:hypothetical protein
MRPEDYGERFKLKSVSENIADFNDKLGEALENRELENEMREFDSGATRDSDDSKLDYEGFLSPYTLRRYAEYMNKHRIQADGKPRDSDNWQKGIPLTAYMKSLWRHLIEAWTLHRSGSPQAHYPRALYEMEEALCAIIFNASGYLHEMMKPKIEEKVLNMIFEEDKNDS